jgi:hypothetical protein
MDKDKFFTWKEIADYLDCNPRTCRRWEKKYDLPVKRIDDSSSLRVFAVKNEIDEWLEKRANSQLEIPQKRKWNKAYYFIFILISAVVFFLFLILIPPNFTKNNPSHPHDFKIEKNKLVIFDEKGGYLWDFDTGIKKLVDETHYREHFQIKRPNIRGRYNKPHLIIEDIDNDNQNDVLFSTQTQDNLNEGDLLCFNHKGVQLWQYKLGKEMKYGSKTFSSDYRIEGFDLCDFDYDGNSEILIIVAHRYRFPAQVVLLNSKGEKIGEYWNSGYIADYEFVDLDNDGTKEIILVGVNNEYGKGSLIVLAFGLIKGGSPQKKAEYQCKALEPGSERNYVLFPRTDLDLLEKQISTIGIIGILENKRLFILISDINIIFELNFNLEPIYITLSHDFKQKHSKAQTEGRITSVLNKEYEDSLLNGILYWDGQNWISTPTMTSFWKNKTSDN